MIEIERKFLVKSDDFKAEAFNRYIIKQGFLNSHKERTVRVRLVKEKGYLTIKGLSGANGLSRFEWETELPQLEADDLFKLCEDGIIDKMRYEVKCGKHVFEVDEFFGANKGLIIAEIELKSENEVFTKPEWLGNEVTGIINYYNSQLSRLPYKNWK